MDREKALKKYLLTKNGYFVFAFFLVFGLVFMAASGPVGILAAGGTGLVFLLIIQMPNSSRIDKKLSALKSAGQLDAVLTDFEHASPIWNGKVRVGQKYIFAKNSSLFYTYDEILWVYRFNQRYLFFTIASQVMIGDADGRIRAFCKVKTGNKAGGAQIQEIAQIIHGKNPHAILGFDEQRRQAYSSAVKK